jgi:hypothetical protein
VAAGQVKPPPDHAYCAVLQRVAGYTERFAIGFPDDEDAEREAVIEP